MVKMVIQTDNTCGQATTAMLAGVTLAESVEVYGHTGVSNFGEAKKALDKFGLCFGTTVKVDNRKKDWKIPHTAFVRIKYGRRNVGHFIAKIEGKFYDPSGDIFNSLEELLDHYNARYSHRVLVSHYFEVWEPSEVKAAGKLFYKI